MDTKLLLPKNIRSLPLNDRVTTILNFLWESFHAKNIRGLTGLYDVDAVEFTQVGDLGTLVIVEVVDGGSGYTSVPVVTAEDPFGGETAELIAVVSGGKVIEVRVVKGGKGYKKAPNIVVAAPGSGVRAVVRSKGYLQKSDYLIRTLGTSLEAMFNASDVDGIGDPSLARNGEALAELAAGFYNLKGTPEGVKYAFRLLGIRAEFYDSLYVNANKGRWGLTEEVDGCSSLIEIYWPLKQYLDLGAVDKNLDRLLEALMWICATFQIEYIRYHSDTYSADGSLPTDRGPLAYANPGGPYYMALEIGQIVHDRYGFPDPNIGVYIGGFTIGPTTPPVPSAGNPSPPPITEIVPDGTQMGSSLVATVEDVPTPPIILVQPQGASINEASGFTLSVTAGGTLPLEYQWIKDFVTISGATGPSFSKTSATLADAGIYTCRVQNIHGLIFSSQATMTVVANTIVITLQPISQSLEPTNSVTFTVAATGTAPLTYDWRKNGLSLGLPSGNSIAIANIDSTHSGSYTVLISNPAGSVLSNAATLDVVQAPQLNLQASYLPPTLVLAPRFNGGWQYFPVYNPTNREPEPFTHPASSAFYHGPEYPYLISEEMFSENEATAIYARDLVLPQITGFGFIGLFDDPSRFPQGSRVTLNAVASGSGTLTYLWKKDGVSVAELGLPQGNSTLRLWRAQHRGGYELSGSYTVEITNDRGTITSSPVSVSVLTQTNNIHFVLPWMDTTFAWPVRAYSFSEQYTVPAGQLVPTLNSNSSGGSPQWNVEGRDQAGSVSSTVWKLFNGFIGDSTLSVSFNWTPTATQSVFEEPLGPPSFEPPFTAQSLNEIIVSRSIPFSVDRLRIFGDGSTQSIRRKLGLETSSDGITWTYIGDFELQTGGVLTGSHGSKTGSPATPCAVHVTSPITARFFKFKTMHSDFEGVVYPEGTNYPFGAVMLFNSVQNSSIDAPFYNPESGTPSGMKRIYGPSIGKTILNRIIARFWATVTSSADGLVMAAGGSNGFSFGDQAGPNPTFISTNSGMTWGPSGTGAVPGPMQISRIIASSNGQKFLMIANYSTIRSNDTGLTWAAVTGTGLVAYAMQSLCASTDHQRIFLGPGGDVQGGGGALQVSANGGATWNSYPSSGPLDAVTIVSFPGTIFADGPLHRYWWKMACNPTGQKLVALVESPPRLQPLATINPNLAKLYLSDDFGVNWFAPLPSSTVIGTLVAVGGGDAIATSSTGNLIVMVGRWNFMTRMILMPGPVESNFLAGILVSTDRGLTWNSYSAPSAMWTGVAMSDDGSKIYATTNKLSPPAFQFDQGTPGRIYKSVDFGQTWNFIGPAMEWASIFCSADGDEVIAGTSWPNDSAVYVSVNSGATWTKKMF